MYTSAAKAPTRPRRDTMSRTTRWSNSGWPCNPRGQPVKSGHACLAARPSEEWLRPAYLVRQHPAGLVEALQGTQVAGADGHPSGREGRLHYDVVEVQELVGRRRAHQAGETPYEGGIVPDLVQANFPPAVAPLDPSPMVAQEGLGDELVAETAAKEPDAGLFAVDVWPRSAGAARRQGVSRHGKTHLFSPVCLYLEGSGRAPGSTGHHRTRHESTR